MRSIGQLVNLIKYSPLTEKTVNLKKASQYVLVLDRSLSKPEIKLAFESIFNFKVLSVNTCTLPPKIKRVRKSVGKKPRFKKAFITVMHERTDEKLLN